MRTLENARITIPTMRTCLPPIRSERIPARGDATSSASAKGSMRVPVWIGSMPRTDWQYSGTRKMAPMSAKFRMTPAVMPTE
jgi:hypothetical protein